MRVKNKEAIYTDYEMRFAEYFLSNYSTSAKLPLNTQKAFSKWRKALNPKNEDGTLPTKIGFRGTLSNLELLCDTANVRPNDVLLPPEQRGSSVERIEFVDRSTVITLCESIRKNRPSKSFYVPILYDPLRMVFLFAYVNCGRNQRRIQYWITDASDPSEDEDEDALFSETPLLDTYPIPADPFSQKDDLSMPMLEVFFAPGKGCSIADAYDRAVSYYNMRRKRGITEQTEYSRCSAEIAKLIPEESRHGKLFELFPVDQPIMVTTDLDNQGSSLDILFRNAEYCARN